MNTLSAEKRDMQIKAKKLRREGFVTGNVFGKNMEGSMPLKIEKKEAERILRTCNKGSQLILTVEGQKMPVLLKEIDYNAMKHEIVEMDFQALVKGEKVHSVAEVVLLNHEKVNCIRHPSEDESGGDSCTGNRSTQCSRGRRD